MIEPIPAADPTADPAHNPVAFIGLGVMGRSMALNLVRAGYPLAIYSRTMASPAVDELIASGAVAAVSIVEAVESAAFTISIVGFPAEVRAVHLEPGGVIENARPGSVVIDMTTSEPALARAIDAAARARGIAALDAPVSGGDVGARGGTLSIMVGGEAEAFARARPLLAAMGRTIVHQGPAGSGQHTKLCNQVVIASTMIGVMEGLLYARRAGLDPDRVLESIGAGAAGSWTLANLYPRAVRGDFAPGFYARHFLKDIEIALAEATRMGIRLPGLALAETLYRRLVEGGGGLLGTQALYRVLDAEGTGAPIFSADTES